MKTKYWLFAALFIIVSFCFAGETVYEYSIHYAGLPVAEVELSFEDDDSLKTITLQSTSKGLISALFSIENTYVSFCDTFFLPFRFWKTIDQQNVNEKKMVFFDHKTGEIVVRNVLLEEADTLRFTEPVYDIISMTFSLLSDVPDQKYYSCYGNYRIWKLDAKKIKEVTKKFDNRVIECFKYKIDSEVQQDFGINAKTDILTNNIFKKRGTTYYWVSKEAPHFLLRATYKRFPFSINLYLKNIYRK